MTMLVKLYFFRTVKAKSCNVINLAREETTQVSQINKDVK